MSLVLPEVLANLVELMMDPFGNYLVQKMLDRCNEEQRLEVRCSHCAVPVTDIVADAAAGIYLPFCDVVMTSPWCVVIYERVPPHAVARMAKLPRHK